MEKFIAANGCPKCNQSLEFGKMVYYTNPLQWSVKCTECKWHGSIGYKGIRDIYLPENKVEEANKITNMVDYRKFIDEHGIVKQRDIVFK